MFRAEQQTHSELKVALSGCHLLNQTYVPVNTNSSSASTTMKTQIQIHPLSPTREYIMIFIVGFTVFIWPIFLLYRSFPDYSSTSTPFPLVRDVEYIQN